MTIEEFYNKCRDAHDGSKFLVFIGFMLVYVGKYWEMPKEIKHLAVGSFSVKFGVYNISSAEVNNDQSPESSRSGISSS